MQNNNLYGLDLLKQKIKVYFRTITTGKVALILVVVGLILYANSFNNQFIWDDQYQIVENVYVKEFNLEKFFTKNLTAGAGRADNYYRPLVLTSFAIDYKLWGLNPSGFHATNLALHILSAFLVYLIISLLQSRKSVAFLTSILFLIHPIQVEAVTYIAGRTDLIPSFFILLSLYLFIKYYKAEIYKNWYYIGSFLSFVFALLSKESSIVLVPLLILVYLVFINRKINGPNLKHLALQTLPFLFLAVIYLALKFTVFKFTNDYTQPSPEIYQNTFQFFRVLVEYWKMLIAPLGLHYRLDQSFPTSTYNYLTIISILSFAGIVYWAWLSWRKQRIVFFAFVWFFIILAPVSGILIKLNYPLAERWLYLASVGIFFLVANGLFLLVKNFIKKEYVKVVIVIVGFIFIYLSALSIHYNSLWKNSFTYYPYLLQFYPEDLDININLAITYDQNGYNELAIDKYEKVLEIDPYNYLAYFNLGGFYADRKDYTRAVEYYKQAVKLQPQLPDAHNNLGRVFTTIGNYDDAIVEFEALRDLYPNSWQPYSLLGQVYALKKDYMRSEENLRKAIMLNPDDQDLRVKLQAVIEAQ